MNLIISRTKLLILLLFTKAAVAQSVYESPTGLKDTQELLSFYHTFISESDPMFNGCEYDRYPFYINKGIPYFISDTMTLGSVMYNGILYEKVPLMYDMIIDELITTDFSGKNMIKLVKQKVDSFYLNGATFILIRDDNKMMRSGYYQLQQVGNNEFLKKEIKSIKDKVRYGEALEKNIESKITYYVKRDGKYFISNSPVNN